MAAVFTGSAKETPAAEAPRCIMRPWMPRASEHSQLASLMARCASSSSCAAGPPISRPPCAPPRCLYGPTAPEKRGRGESTVTNFSITVCPAAPVAATPAASPRDAPTHRPPITVPEVLGSDPGATPARPERILAASTPVNPPGAAGGGRARGELLERHFRAPVGRVSMRRMMARGAVAHHATRVS